PRGVSADRDRAGLAPGSWPVGHLLSGRGSPRMGSLYGRCSSARPRRPGSGRTGGGDRGGAFARTARVRAWSAGDSPCPRGGRSGRGGKDGGDTLARGAHGKRSAAGGAGGVRILNT